MSKISPMQAQALGLKPTPPKAPAVNPAIEKTAAPKVATKPQAKTAVAAKPKTAPLKTSTKPATKLAVPAKAATAKSIPAKKDSKKEDKKPKLDKVKMERDSFTMPKDEYAQIALLKARLTSLGQPAKKSELLRAGIKLLAAMSDNTLKTTLAKIPVIKTGRPNKKD
ncbi:MAG: hypothetical protein V4552_00790 [Pseudomonadota bacterium]